MNGYIQNPVSILRQMVRGVKALKTFHLSDLRKVFSLMGKSEKIALVLLAVAAMLSLTVSANGFYVRHTQVVPALGGQLTEGVIGQPQYINPILALSDTDQALTRLVFSGLYKYDASGQLAPDLAEGLPQISDDQKSYTVNLKHNARWHNQKPVTADDVVFTIQTLKNPDFKSPLRPFWLNTTVEKLSDYQVRFTNKDISGPFVYNLTLPILPKDVWGATDPSGFLLNKNNLEAIGCGPYAITQINKLPSGKISSIILKSFAGYYGLRANIETFTVKFYDSQADLLNGLRGKEIDLAGVVPAPGDDINSFAKNFDRLNLPLPQYQIAYFNLNDGLLNSSGVRQALALATDRQAIINDVFQGQRGFPIDPMTKVSDAAYGFNLAAAGDVLEKAGWNLSQDGLRRQKDQILGITITTSDSPANALVVQSLQKQWQAAGFQVYLDIKSGKELAESVIPGRKFQVLVFSQKFGTDPDPFFFWHSSQAKDPGLNLTGLSDPGLDKLLTEARNTTDTASRYQKYAAIDQLIAGKWPEVLLNQNTFVYLVSPKIRDVRVWNLPEPSARFYDLPNWYLQTKRVWK